MLAAKFKAQYGASKNQQTRGAKNYGYVMSRRAQQQSNGVGVKTISKDHSNVVNATHNKSVNCVVSGGHRSGPCGCVQVTTSNTLVASSAGDYMERLKKCATN